MNDSKMTRACRKTFRAPRNVVLAMRFWWRHGPVTPEVAERIDRLRFPQKYLTLVNPVAKI
jgi:hypothetical protein